LKLSYAISRMAAINRVSREDAEYLFEERVAIKQDSGTPEAVAMKEAYQEISGEALK